MTTKLPPHVKEVLGGAGHIFAPEFYAEFDETPSYTLQVDLRLVLPSLADVPLGNHTLTAILLGGLTAEEQEPLAIDSESSHTVVLAASEADLAPVLAQIETLILEYEGSPYAKFVRRHYTAGGASDALIKG
jgi:hypothetical protein